MERRLQRWCELLLVHGSQWLREPSVRVAFLLVVTCPYVVVRDISLKRSSRLATNRLTVTESA